MALPTDIVNMNPANKMRVVVALANYGCKNAAHLKRVIDEYQSMPCETDIIILSDVPKELGAKIEVKVGLPTRDPWSLPFGHKRIFAEQLEDYDLFIYSEDDILITWKNIESFLQISKVLPEGDICGFLRYELDSTGKKWYPDFLGPYHWLPESVKREAQFTFAEFTNVHSACYILTRDQLRRAISSGGYLVKPHEGRYDLLCSAATDPYTQCGFRKVICISHISDMIVHHLPDRYVGQMGIDEDDFDRQISFMLSPEYKGMAGQELFTTTKKINHVRWDKMYFDSPDHELLSIVSPKAGTILSVGCGYPSTEGILARDSRAVTVIPLDPIIGALAAARGIKVMEPDFERAFRNLRGSSFDCIIFQHIVQHLQNPVDILSKAVKLLAYNGEIIVSVPNFSYLKFLKDHFPYPLIKRWTYSEHLLHVVSESLLMKWLRSTGIRGIDIQYVDKGHHFKNLKPAFGMFNVLHANSLLVRGRQTHLQSFD